jgi:hypothetical protein
VPLNSNLPKSEIGRTKLVVTMEDIKFKKIEGKEVVIAER